MKKRNYFKRILSLFLAVTMCLSMIPAQTFAAEKAETRENKKTVTCDWVLQKQNTTETTELQDGWIIPSEDGRSVTINYGKIVADTGNEGWVIFDNAAPKYLNSVLEYDITFKDATQAPWIAVAPVTRVTDGKNYEGFAFTKEKSIERTGRKDGKESYGGITNEAGISFGYDTTYHLRMVTEDAHITVYVTVPGGEEQKLTEFDSPIGLGAGSYGFRIWRGGKTIQVDNITRTEIAANQSKLNETETIVPYEEWCKGSVDISVSFIEGDTVASIEDASSTLVEGSHYSVVDDVIQISNDYLKDKTDSELITLKITFTKGGTAEFKIIRGEKPFSAGGWVFQKQNSSENTEPKDGWISVSEDGKNVTIDYGQVVKDAGEGWVIFDADAPKYLNSVLEYDITFTEDTQAPWIAVAPATRVLDGRNYEGFAITREKSLERTGRKDGSESYAGVDNLAGVNFQYNKKYHLKMVTEGSNITVYCSENGGQEKKLTVFDSPIGLGESTWGFRIWRGGKKIILENIERTEIVTSALGENLVRVNTDEWGKKDLDVSVKFGRDDAVKSILCGSETLVAGTDYRIDGNTLTITKEYIAKHESNFSLTVNFEQGSKSSLWVLRFDPSKRQEYTWTPDQGIDMWADIKGNNNFELTEDGKAMHITGTSALVNTLAPFTADGEIEITFEALHDYDGIDMGALFRAADSKWQAVASVDSINGEGVWNFLNGSGANDRIVWDGVQNMARSGIMDIKVKVRFVDDEITFWIDDQYAHTQSVSKAEAAMGGMGLYVDNKGDILVKKVVFRELLPFAEETGERTTEAIANDGLTVRLDSDFPRVADYTLNGKTLDGSKLRFNYVTINTVDYPATAAAKKSADGKSITYHVTPEGIDVTFDVVFTVKEDQIVEMLIKNIAEPEGMLVNSIGFPDQPLISADSTQEGATLDASWIDKNGRNFNDLHETIANKRISTTANRSVCIPIITANGLSASMMNNVFIGGDEFTFRAFELDNGEVTAGFWNTDFMYRGVDGEKMFPFPSEPDEKDLYCRIAITEDTNGDDIMNWQDGANALKKLNRHLIPGGDQAARSFFHVGYNFASGAQQPFLKVADNLKRLSNYIDGFGQQLVFKGYANEGHDSGHADYEDINKRAGGAEDMNTAIAEADKINANIGIHINSQEAYPEAKMFNDHVMGDRDGWWWMDHSKIIRRYVDMLEGNFDARLNKLYEQVPGIDFVYVDCWGEDRWGEKKLIGNLLNNGCEMFGNENAPDFNRFGVWVHSTSGNEHASIHQFVFNTQRDTYGGGGIFWGGYNRGASMMSWQHKNDINMMVEQFYTNQLPQKYLMCHEVLRMADNTGYFENNITSGNYVITKDGKKLTDGADRIFIPWYAEDSETKNPDEAAKIYHWNKNGGSTTWDLPENWENVKTVYLYQTTQNGKKLVETIDVTADHKVTINAKAKTPYVVYPAETAADETVWSVGSLLKDTGFNSRDFSIWKKDGDADIQFNDDGNGVSILTMEGTEEGSVSQTMEGLKVGQKYRVLVWAGSANGKTATLSVQDGDQVYSSYVDQIVKNCDYFDNYAKGKPVQRVWVDFTAKNTTATVTLTGEACENTNGKVTFMESRIVETAEPDLPAGYAAIETFEYVEQGAYGIFNPERSADGVPHLAESHRPYTGNDTITGDWSLKMDGRAGKVDVRTNPTVVRLKSNTEYSVEFNTVNSGWVSVESESNGSDQPLSRQNYSDGAHKYTFTTGDKEDYIVRIGGTTTLDDFVIYEGTVAPPTDSVTDEFKITVNGEVKATGKYNTKVTLTAPKEEGKTFTGWMLDGKVVSTDETYTFYISEDMDFTACYEEIKLDPLALMTNTFLTKRSDTKSDVKFVGQLVVPDGYTIKNAGLVWSSKDDVVLETGVTGAKTTSITKISNTNQFSVTIKGMPEGKFVRGRIFATLVDEETGETTVYSEEVKVIAR